VLLTDLAALAQVLLIDLTLAGDNAVVVGLAVTGLPPRQKARAILFGTVAAALIRIGFGAVTLQLLAIVGMTLAGGLLLLWVCWKMYRELWRSRHHAVAGLRPPKKSLRSALVQVALADVSMSLDNVLAVAGASHGRLWVMTVGIAVSVLLMGIAAGLIARLLERHRWIAWIGLMIVLVVAVRLIWDGSQQVAGAIT